MLTPSEEKRGFIEKLNASKPLPLKKLSMNPSKTVLVTQRAAALVASNPDLQRLAKKAFKSYVRSIYLMPQKDVFDVKDLPLEEYGKSLGLSSSPNLRFLKDAAKDRDEFRQRKNINHKLQKLKDQIKAEKLAKKLNKMGKSEEEIKALTSKDGSNNDSDEDGDDTILVSKGQQTWKDQKEDKGIPSGLFEIGKSKHPKKIRIDGSNVQNKHVVFTEFGVAADPGSFMSKDETELASAVQQDKAALEKATSDYMEKVRQRLMQNSQQDLVGEKERLKEKRKKRRLKEKGDRNEAGLTDTTATLCVANSDLDDDDDEQVSDSQDDASLQSGSSTEIAGDLQKQEDLALSLIRSN